MAMKIRHIEQWAALEEHRSAWNALLQRSPTNTIFQTFEWFASWWEAFGSDYELRFLLGFDGDSLVAAAPLVLSRRRRYGRPVKRLEFAGAAPSDYADFLYQDESSARRLIQALRAELPWDALDFNRVPSVSPTLAILAEEFPGWRGTAFRCDVASAYVFDPAHDGSEILKKKSLRRHSNGLRKAGTVTVRHLTQAEDIAPELEAFFQQHIERRAHTPVPSALENPREQTFYRRLTHFLPPHGWVLFTIVTLNGQAVAFHYGFVYERCLLWYKPTFSLQHAHLSPGEVLIAELFHYCRASALSEFDFTIGAAPFKDRFTNVKRYNTQFQAFRSDLWQQINHTDRTLRERAKRVRFVHQLRSAWRRVQSRVSAGGFQA